MNPDPHSPVPPHRAPGIPSLDLLGVRVSVLTLRGAVDELERWIEQGVRSYVCVTGVHGLIECRDDPDLRSIHNRAGLVTTDGMPLVWLCRRRGFRRAERVYGPDLLLALCERTAPGGRRHFFFGGAPGVPERLAERLTARFPGLVTAGALSPPMRPCSPGEDAEIVARIEAARPDVVWVGLSTPKQERWMAAHRDRLSAPALIGVGAAFDFHSGLKRQAPAWMRRSGLEWFFRLLCEPRRLGKRYLVNNTRFLGLLLKDEWRQMRGRGRGRQKDVPTGRA